uniref:Uncharacterized protein n=1 Tax=Cannabis sativa TaxID=3483 RepID=A0A803PSF1_CANSA
MSLPLPTFQRAPSLIIFAPQDSFPHARSSRGAFGIEEGGIGIITTFQYSGQQGVRIMDKTPPLFGQKCLVKLFQTSKPQAPFFFRLAQLVPSTPMKFLIVFCIAPPKVGSQEVEAFDKLFKAKTTHRGARDSLNHDLNKDFLSRLGKHSRFLAL